MEHSQFDLETLPRLIREDVAHGEAHPPGVPADVPDVVAADPGWCTASPARTAGPAPR